MTPGLSLVNIRCPNHLKDELDHILDQKHLSRTHVLLSLIEKYIREENEYFISQNNTIKKPQSSQSVTKPIDDRSIFLQY